MKRKILFLAFVIMAMIPVCAQTDYSQYINKTMTKLEEGDCTSATKYYNVYKELSGKSVSSIEVLINECGKEKRYTVGENITVGDKSYIVAYTRDGGQHGLAVFNTGWKPLDENLQLYVTKRGIPTFDELELIFANRDKIRLYDVYWSCTKAEGTSCSPTCYKFIDFASGQKDHGCCSRVKCILLIHRF